MSAEDYSDFTIDALRVDRDALLAALQEIDSLVSPMGDTLASAPLAVIMHRRAQRALQEHAERQ